MPTQQTDTETLHSKTGYRLSTTLLQGQEWGKWKKKDLNVLVCSNNLPNHKHVCLERTNKHLGSWRHKGVEQLHFTTLFTAEKRKYCEEQFLIIPLKEHSDGGIWELQEGAWLRAEEVRAMKILHGQILNVIEEVRALNDQNVKKIKIIEKQIDG